MAWAEVLECPDIFIGVNAIDYSGYPDCRPEFIEAFERMANLATKAAVEGRTPAQVAARVGLSVGAVYVAKSRVIARLREEIERLQGEEP